MNWRSSIKFNGKEGVQVKTRLDRVSWRTLFMMLGVMIVIKLLLEL